MQATWNLIERSAGDELRQAHDAGMGVIIKEAVANGRLTARGDVSTLQQVAHGLGATPDALALAAVLAQPWVDVVLSGAATVEQLQSNLTALDIAWSSALDAQLESIAEDPDHYWSARAKLPWN